MIEGAAEAAGLPPGTLMHVGPKRAEKVRITVMDYSEAGFQEKEVSAVEECYEFRDTPTVTWINVDGIHDVNIVRKLGDYFGLHPLLLEDVVMTGQRPKVDDYGDYLFVVVKMLTYDCRHEVTRAEQVSLVVGANFVISFQETEGDVFDGIRDRIRTGKGRVRKMSADYLAYALIDAVVDGYFTILEHNGEKVEELEERVVSHPAPETSRDIHRLKREAVFLRRSVWPLREVIGALQRTESALIHPATIPYLRDIYDHTIQVIDTIEATRDTLSAMVDIYLSSLSNRLNEVMKVLTIIATIFIPLTFITGLYGMNFHYMPELDWRWGYPSVLVLMTVIAVFMLFYFRRKKWL